jgi:hypothetical protein
MSFVGQRMNLRNSRRWVWVVSAVIVLGGVLVAAAQEQAVEKPLLSAAIRKALADGGLEDAQKRFDEIYPAQKDKYELDAPALMLLGADSMKAGDAKTAQAIMQMGMTVLQAEGAAPGAAGLMPPPSAMPPGAPGVPNTQKTEPADRPTIDAGPARKDLSRFYGVYGAADSRRQVFVRETCDGHLQLGAMWGDVAPWTMKSLSDATFEQAFVPSMQTTPPLKIVFELGEDGKAHAVRHPLLGEMQTAARAGDLPDGWDERDCGEER